MTRENQGSLLVAHWGGVSVRVHLYFWILAASTLYLSLTARDVYPKQEGLFLEAMLSLIGLAGSLFLHELGHWIAIRRYGGTMPNLVIGPINGMGAIDAPKDPRLQLVVYLAGPAVNLLIALIAFTLLSIYRVPSVPWLHLALHENWPGRVFSTGLQLIFTINWLLCMVNMVPSLMFDGGRVMRAVLLWKWPGLGVLQAERWVANATRLLSASLLLMVVLSWQWGWAIEVLLVPLALFSVFLFFSSEVHASRGEIPASPSWQGQPSTSADSDTLRERKVAEPPPIDWPAVQEKPIDEDGKQSPPELRQPAVPNGEFRSAMPRDTTETSHSFLDDSAEAEEERRMDDLLARVHQQGMDSLSSEEFAFMQKVSARYRERRQRVTPT